MAILGAMGMGCAGFFAEQHALISYNIVPGVPTSFCFRQGYICAHCSIAVVCCLCG